jgi:hypothetical protein
MAGCSHAQPSAAPYPSPLPSGAQPAAVGKGDIAYAHRGAELIRKALHHLEPETAVATVPRTGVAAAADVVVGCVAAPGELPVILCHYGPSAGQPVAQAIFWHDRAQWQSQLYPQAPSKLAVERREGLAGMELECQVGCFSAITSARQLTGQNGPELVVVVNLAAAGPVKAEEVHLLRLSGGMWDLAWVPSWGNWNYGHAEVTLTTSGGSSFRVRSSSWARRDWLTGYLAEPVGGEHRWFADRWERRGESYFLRDRSEEAGPYGTLLRAIHYLTTGADEKAQALLSPTVDLEVARKALAQKPKRQGWKATPWGDSGFMLDTRNSGKPDRAVRLEHQDGRWVLAEVKELRADSPAAGDH